MIVFAGTAFFFSFAGIACLFALKLREQETGRVLAPRLRHAADIGALRVKDLLSAAHLDLKKLPPLVVYAGQMMVHFAALEFARAARTASRRSHQLADLVSHKRNFQRRQTRSEFLKKMRTRKRSAVAGRQDRTERVEF